MGNGVPFNIICCNQRNEPPIEDIDINKNANEFLKNTKTIKITNKDKIKNSIINKNNQNNKNNNYKKVQTHSGNSSNNDSEKKLQKLNKGDSVSHRDPNISLFNNTFQILNNTQQYISFSNMNLFKNNLINNQIIKSLYNSKLNSSIINFSKINSNFDDIGYVNKKLILTGDLFFNKIIEIDKYGMKNSLRLKHDGIAIFGYKVGNDNTNLPQFDYYLDLKINKKDNIYRNKKKENKGKVFEIFLDKKEKVFLLYYLHSTLLLYYKINDNFFFEIDKEYFFIVGDIFLSINVKKAINSNEKILNIEVDYEDEKPKKYIFEQKDVPIKIGRINCTINIPKPSISKLHSIIDFSDDNYIYKDANSTNGSTLLLKEDDILKIKGEMNFKLEEISFKIKEIIIDEN